MQTPNLLPTFIDNKNFIAFVVCIIIILVGLLSFLLFKDKIKNKRFLKQNYIISFIFVIALIFSLIFLAVSNFNTIGDEYWLTYSFYFSGAATSILLTIIFLLAIFLLPFRYIYAISFLLEDKQTKKRIINITFFYIINATLAILITCLCYFFKDSFFKYDFDLGKLRSFGYTSFYYYTRYIFTNIIMKPSFSFYLIIALIAFISIATIILVILKRKKYYLYVKVSNFSWNLTKKFKWQDKVLPLFVFTATSSSLLSQPLATLLHIILILILFMLFSLITISFNFGVSYIRLKKYFDFKQISKKTFISFFSFKQESIFQNVFANDKRLDQYIKNQDHKFFYKLLSISILPIIITGYLGFCSTGPLLQVETPWSHHLWFWLTLFAMPYILGYAYIFSDASTSSCKMLMNMSTAYIASGFNSGILVYFNPIINKISEYAIFGYELVFIKPETDIKQMQIDNSC